MREGYLEFLDGLQDLLEVAGVDGERMGNTGCYRS
jgi:hypothetical protein